jgi:hypothetical protein
MPTLSREGQSDPLWPAPDSRNGLIDGGLPKHMFELLRKEKSVSKVVSILLKPDYAYFRMTTVTQETMIYVSRGLLACSVREKEVPATHRIPDGHLNK